MLSQTSCNPNFFVTFPLGLPHLPSNGNPYFCVAFPLGLPYLPSKYIGPRHLRTNRRPIFPLYKAALNPPHLTLSSLCFPNHSSHTHHGSSPLLPTRSLANSPPPDVNIYTYVTLYIFRSFNFDSTLYLGLGYLARDESPCCFD